MSDILFHAHSGLRYLVLLVGVITLLYSLVAAVRRQPWDRPGRILLRTFVGLLDLQILLGVALIFTREFYPMLWGHLVMMLLAAAAAHIASALNRRRPIPRQSHTTAALGVAGALVLIIGGILAIGRSIVG